MESMQMTVKLNNGEQMPMVALGTSRMGISDEVTRVVKMAIDLGYRHLDTAERYVEI